MDFEDDDFLYQVAEAEALALAAKRRKLTTVVPTSSTASSTASSQPKTITTEQKTPEGAYIAALRGIKSSEAGSDKALAGEEYGGSGGGGGSCFKCGNSGHWARDCGVESYASDVPEKACPCGLGACAVRTANTEKNRGRKFYACPQREENGGCGFFEWCDKNNGNEITMRSQSYGSNPSVPDLSCPCGAGSCRILTAKKGNNIGQQFYCCPASQENSCRFFKWCHDLRNADELSVSVNSNMYNSEMNKRNSGTGTNDSSCFKCGKEGHWAKDCHLPSNQNPVGHGQKYADTFSASVNPGFGTSGSSCFKCGKEGHWAKDCQLPSNQSVGSVNPKVYINEVNKSNSGFGTSGSSCFKCGKEGHWAKDCQLPSNQNVVGRGRSTASSASCYKCGNSGHWANNCSSS